MSDVLEYDIQICLDWMMLQAGEDPRAGHLSRRLRSYLRSRRLVIKPHSFYNTAYAFWEVPADLRGSLDAADPEEGGSRVRLTIVKGDANYRRLIGDRHWDYLSTSFGAFITSYFPSPLLALRTLKSNTVRIVSS